MIPKLCGEFTYMNEGYITTSKKLLRENVSIHNTTLTNEQNAYIKNILQA